MRTKATKRGEARRGLWAVTRDVWANFYFVLRPTNAQLSHKLAHSYMFKHHRVTLRKLVINEDDTIVSKHVGV